MNKEILKQLKEEYDERKKENNKNKLRLEVLKNRKNLLLNNPLVLQYLENEKKIEITNNLLYSDYEIISDILSNSDTKEIMKETNKIFYYTGSHSMLIDDKSVIFAYYVDIESLSLKIIDENEREEFENNNNVIVNDLEHKNKDLKNIRKNFIIDIFNLGQDEAKVRVLSKNKKNL